MTTVCFVGEPEGDPREAMLAFETVQQALSPYDVTSPYVNAISVETISLGAAVALLDDLAWYLRRTVREAIVLEPSISADEWLSSELARAIRRETVRPDETAGLVKVYGVEDGILVDPMYAERRADGTLPAYDLRDVDDTIVIRVSRRAFGG